MLSLLIVLSFFILLYYTIKIAIIHGINASRLVDHQEKQSILQKVKQLSVRP